MEKTYEWTSNSVKPPSRRTTIEKGCTNLDYVDQVAVLDCTSDRVDIEVYCHGWMVSYVCVLWVHTHFRVRCKGSAYKTNRFVSSSSSSDMDLK